MTTKDKNHSDLVEPAHADPRLRVAIIAVAVAVVVALAAVYLSTGFHFNRGYRTTCGDYDAMSHSRQSAVIRKAWGRYPATDADVSGAAKVYRRDCRLSIKQGYPGTHLDDLGP